MALPNSDSQTAISFAASKYAYRSRLLQCTRASVDASKGLTHDQCRRCNFLHAFCMDSSHTDYNSQLLPDSGIQDQTTCSRYQPSHQARQTARTGNCFLPWLQRKKFSWYPHRCHSVELSYVDTDTGKYLSFRPQISWHLWTHLPVEESEESDNGAVPNIEPLKASCSDALQAALVVSIYLQGCCNALPDVFVSLSNVRNILFGKFIYGVRQTVIMEILKRDWAKKGG